MNTPRNPNIPINPDDPKWTAYVLGELDETERAEIDRLLDVSEEARALVEELTVATASMKEELSSLTPLMLTAEQKAAIRNAAGPVRSRWSGIFQAKWVMGLAAAAVVVAAVALPLLLPRNEQDGFSDALTQTVQNIPREDPTAPARSDTAGSSSRETADIARPQQANETAQANAGLQQQSPKAVAPVLTPEEFAEVAQGDARGLPQTRILTVDQKLEVQESKKDTNAPGAPAGPSSSTGTPVDQPRIQPNPIDGTRDSSAAASPTAQAAPPSSAPEPLRQAPAAGGGRGGRAAARGQQQQESAARTAPGIGAGSSGGVLGAIQAAPPPPPPPPPPGRTLDKVYIPAPNTEAYDRIVDNPFVRTTQENLATFSIDVDTASYANVRRFLNQNQLPPRDAVRIEELINYFSYDYAKPDGNAPIAANLEVAAAPWRPDHRLVRVGIKAREVNANRRPPSNLVFLIDVSGSMNSAEKLPLVKSGLNMLVEQLGENDSVSIVVYAGASGLVLAPTSGIRKDMIRRAIDSLEPGGSTNGASGIQLAYQQATANFLRNGVNRVILMTDGDFNVGITNQGALTRLIEEKAKSGVFLSVLGFGMGNIKDSTLEKLADQGNGSYAYIDNFAEARKVLVEEMSGTLVTVAKDVKIQVDFNPARVEAYRLIGYENRALRTEDFNNDAKDAGDMGAGHTVTALFEVVPKGGEVPGPSIDPSKYTRPEIAEPARNVGSSTNEMLTLRVRYKLPNADTSARMDVPLVDRGASFSRASQDFRFAAAVAEFGMILRNSQYRGNATVESALDIAEGSRGADRNGYRSEFITLLQRAQRLWRPYGQ